MSNVFCAGSIRANLLANDSLFSILLDPRHLIFLARQPQPPMKNRFALFALATTATLALSAVAGPLDRPGATPAASPAPGGAATPKPGVGTSTALAPSIKSMKVMGIVVQKQPNGVVLNPIIQRGDNKPKDFFFVEGDFPKAFNGDKVTCMATDSGMYDYKPTAGGAVVAQARSVNNAPNQKGAPNNTVPVGQAGQIRKMTFVRW